MGEATEAMRQDLERYLSESRHRLLRSDDRGSPLVHIPANFESIASAMTREDLESTEDKDWSYYLLDAKFDSDASTVEFEEGRYKSLFETGYYHNNEAKESYEANKGLAEIALLDRQLTALNRRAKAMKEDNQDTFLTRVPLGSEITNDSEPSITSLKFPVTSDELRIALILQEEEEGEQSGMKRLLSSHELQRLREIDRQLSEFNSPARKDIHSESGFGLNEGDEEARVVAEQRLSRVRREYAAALDEALSQLWSRGASTEQGFVPHLRPVSLTLDDLHGLAQSSYTQHVDSIRLDRSVTRADVAELLTQLQSQSIAERDTSEELRVAQLLSTLRKEVDLLTSLRSKTGVS